MSQEWEKKEAARAEKTRGDEKKIKKEQNKSPTSKTTSFLIYFCTSKEGESKNGNKQNKHLCYFSDKGRNEKKNEKQEREDEMSESKEK